MPRALIVEIFGDAKQFGAELDRAAGKTRSLSKVAGVAGLALAGGLAFGLERSVKAAMAGEVSQKQLDQALQNTHQSLKAMEPALLAAEGASRKLGFTDDETRTSLAKLEIATGDTGKAITDLSLAEDLARLKHTDLDSATKMLTSTLAGNARAAKQLGISIIPVSSHMDELKAKYAELGKAIPSAEAAQARFLDKQATGVATLQAVTDKVHGQAEAFSSTAAGGMAQFHAQVQHLEEVLGGGLLPALAGVAAALAGAFGFLADHTTATKILVGALAVLATTLIAVSVASSIAAAAAGIAAAATGIWTAAQWLLNAALTANPIGLVIVGLVALGAALVIAYQKSQTFRTFVSEAFNAVKAVAQTLATFITVTIPKAFQDVLNWVRSNWPAIATIVAGPFAPLVALATNAFGVRSAIVGAFNAIVDSARSIWRQVANAVSNSLEDVVALIRGLPKRILAALGNVSGLLFDAGDSIIQGLINGLTSKLGEVEHLASSIAGKIKSLKGPIEHDRRLLMPEGQAIIEGLQAGMEGALSGMYASVSQIAPGVKSAAGGSLAATAASGGGGTLNVTVNVPNFVGSKTELQQLVTSAVVQANRKGSLLAADLR